VYQEDVLQGVVKPLNTAVFNGQKLVSQQDSAPAHRAKMSQEWLQRCVPAFISTEDRPLGSPDLNPLDINCGLFWRTWLAESITTTWRA